MLPGGTALVELATASGLPLLGDHLAPLTANTRGTGQTIAAALELGARRLMVALGGSASTDAGSGLLAALGLRVLDRDGIELPDGGAALHLAHRVDRSGLRPGPKGGVLLLTDVTNPPLGATGAAAVYGPQKGATLEDIALLERGLRRFAGLLGGDADRPGSGAAGGAAYGLSAAWSADITPGAVAIADLLRLDAALAAADLTITGEGRFDATSLLGKAVGEVLARSERAGVQARVVAGDSTDTQALALTALAGDKIRAQRDAAHWLRHAGSLMARSAAGAGRGSRTRTALACRGASGTPRAGEPVLCPQPRSGLRGRTASGHPGA